MRVLEIDTEGKVHERTGEPDFWMDPDIVWSSIQYGKTENHHIYYDDDSMSDPGSVRIRLGSVELPLPVWITGENGEETGPATLTIEKVEADIQITG